MLSDAQIGMGIEPEYICDQKKNAIKDFHDLVIIIGKWYPRSTRL